MSTFLKHRVTGVIFRYSPILAENPMCERVSEEEAFPEKFKNPKTIAKAKARGKPVDVSTDEAVIAAATQGEAAGQAAVNADASKGLPA